MISPSGSSDCPPLSFERHHAFRKLEVKLVRDANREGAVGWLSETLPTITSNVFTKLTISINLDPFSCGAANENLVRGWSPVDRMLNRFGLCEDVTLAVRVENWVEELDLRGLIEKYFPLMWGNGRVVFEVLEYDMDSEYVIPRRRCRK